jgi:hypothetical protein
MAVLSRLSCVGIPEHITVEEKDNGTITPGTKNS